MAPTEESILRSFLLSKSGLRDVVTLAEFTSFFPPSKRNSPLVRRLYRDLQGQRNAICEGVSKQINMERNMGERLIAQRRAARADFNSIGEDGGMEAHLIGDGIGDGAVRVESIVVEMEAAMEKLRENMDKTQEAIDDALAGLQKYLLAFSTELISRICGEMSDLKYGSTDQHVVNELQVSRHT